MIDEHTLSVLEFAKVKKLIASYALFPLGAEQIERIVPSDDLETISRKLKEISEFTTLISLDEPIPLSGIKDIRPCLERCKTQGAILLPEDFLRLRETLRVCRLIRGYFSEKRKKKYPLLFSIATRLVSHPELEEKIERTIDPGGEVKSSASPELAKIRSEIERSRDLLHRKLEEILKRLPDSVLQERVITLRNSRYVIPIRAGQQGRLKGIIHDQSASGATLFMEPLVTLEISNRIQQLEVAEQREVERILDRLTQEVVQVRDELAQNVFVLGQLDAICAKASYALATQSTEPLVNNEGRIVIKKGRHPLLIELLGKQNVVPLDLRLGEDFFTLVVTGPNAGGKTVALKTVGLLTLMVQSGLHIPAEPGSEIAVFQDIFADIGDEQSLEQDLSTFSSHVRQWAKACSLANSNTLVLLDEIGSGTNPEEGVALAIAILRTLTSRGARTIATTHHGALKLFAYREDKAENGSMQFDSATLMPTFRFQLGMPGSSYAFQIARKLGLSEGVIADAASYMGQDSRRVEDLIGDLEKKAQALSQESQQLESTRLHLQKLVTVYEEKLGKVKEEAKQLKRKALEEAKQIVQQANALVEQTVAEIRNQKASTEVIKQSRKQVRKSVEQIESQLERLTKTERRRPIQVKAGDRVWIELFHCEGEVLKEADSSGRIQVQVGKTKFTVPIDQVGEAKGEQRASLQKVSAALPFSTTVPDRIDLRGMVFEEASAAVDKYLDSAYLAGWQRVTVIHGKGTGALRAKIGAFLRQHPRVKAQRLGNWDEGGEGVTIVELKDGETQHLKEGTKLWRD
ncbi:MAG: endonuclease MutS2 [Candidatus Latescibacterota bacterium]|nr:MAG: endonuclease MutS2 [Candidatus Latescibacterota bacterium]RKY73011.1 MAG: endonuclease MutS2 [Candidatus Latescibacterota bacterium]